MTEIRDVAMQSEDSDVEMRDAYLASPDSLSPPSSLPLAAADTTSTNQSVFKFGATAVSSNFKKPFSFKKAFKFQPATKIVERSLGFRVLSFRNQKIEHSLSETRSKSYFSESLSIKQWKVSNSVRGESSTTICSQGVNSWEAGFDQGASVFNNNEIENVNSGGGSINQPLVCVNGVSDAASGQDGFHSAGHLTSDNCCGQEPADISDSPVSAVEVMPTSFFSLCVSLM